MCVRVHVVCEANRPPGLACMHAYAFEHGARRTRPQTTLASAAGFSRAGGVEVGKMPARLCSQRDEPAHNCLDEPAYLQLAVGAVAVAPQQRGRGRAALQHQGQVKGDGAKLRHGRRKPQRRLPGKGGAKGARWGRGEGQLPPVLPACPQSKCSTQGPHPQRGRCGGTGGKCRCTGDRQGS